MCVGMCYDTNYLANTQNMFETDAHVFLCVSNTETYVFMCACVNSL